MIHILIYIHIKITEWALVTQFYANYGLQIFEIEGESISCCRFCSLILPKLLALTLATSSQLIFTDSSNFIHHHQASEP